jgi:uncharacterized tellurite resistance protein B-like protein
MMNTTSVSLASFNPNELEAFVELMLLAAYSDGVIDDTERAVVQDYLVSSTQGLLTPEIVASAIASVEAALPNRDRQAMLSTIGERIKDRRKRRAALTVAVRVVLADGVLRVEEDGFLRRAAALLGESYEWVDGVRREAQAEG